jgi:AcrR family transcriptional regulator
VTSGPAAGTRGRPRDPGVDRALLDATLGLLAEAGYERLTIDAIAKRAGVGRPTIYRRYESKPALVAAAISAALAARNPAPPDSGDAAEDMRCLLANTIDALLGSAFGPAVTELVAPATHDDRLRAVLDTALEDRRTLMRTVLERAEADARLRAPDVETGIDLLLGAVYFRHLVTRAPLDTAFVSRIVETVIAPA